MIDLRVNLHFLLSTCWAYCVQTSDWNRPKNAAWLTRKRKHVATQKLAIPLIFFFVVVVVVIFYLSSSAADL